MLIKECQYHIIYILYNNGEFFQISYQYITNPLVLSPDEAAEKAKKEKEKVKPPTRLPGLRDAAKKMAKIVSAIVLFLMLAEMPLFLLFFRISSFLMISIF